MSEQYFLVRKLGLGKEVVSLKDMMLASLAGHIFIRLNAMTCLSLRQEHSLVDGVSTLQPQLSGTRFHHIFAHHPQSWTV